MKFSKKLFVALFALAGYSVTVNAQSTATATATATVVTPIAITKTSDMSFGNLSVQAATGGTVVLPASGSRSSTSGVTLPATAGTVTPAAFDVTGTAAYTYAITLPSSVTLNHSAGAGTGTMVASSFVSNQTSNIGTLNGSGSQSFSVGATLTVGAGQAAGVYLSGNFNVTVNYN
jgi:hypothetical protein